MVTNKKLHHEDGFLGENHNWQCKPERLVKPMLNINVVKVFSEDVI